MYPAAITAGHVLPLLLAATAAHPAVVVHPGDTLSGLAVRYCGNASDWTGWYAANHATIGGNPDLILPGQELTPGCRQAPATTGPAHAGGSTDLIPVPGYRPRHAAPGRHAAAGRTWGITYGYPNYCGDGDGDGWDIPCTRLRRSTAQPRTRAAAPQAPSPYAAAPGTFQECVIQRESGGNPRAVNPGSGAGGLYGFLPSSWHSLGYAGLPEDAPVWEQNQAFAREYALAGTAPWEPYDKCSL